MGLYIYTPLVIIWYSMYFFYRNPLVNKLTSKRDLRTHCVLGIIFKIPHFDIVTTSTLSQAGACGPWKQMKFLRWKEISIIDFKNVKTHLSYQVYKKLYIIQTLKSNRSCPVASFQVVISSGTFADDGERWVY